MQQFTVKEYINQTIKSIVDRRIVRVQRLTKPIYYYNIEICQPETIS